MKEEKTFTADFRREAVRLIYESAHTVDSVARDLGIGKTTLTNWCRQFPDAAGDEHTAVDAENLRKLAKLRTPITKIVGTT